MIRPIVSDLKLLRQVSETVTRNDDIKTIIQDLRDTLATKPNGIGLSAIQIGYKKRISIIKVLKSIDEKTKKQVFEELILINPMIVEKSRKIVLQREGCLSFPGLHVDTDRYVFITLENDDEKFNRTTSMLQDLTALAVQHEVDHQFGVTMLDRKHRNANNRRR